MKKRVEIFCTFSLEFKKMGRYFWNSSMLPIWALVFLQGHFSFRSVFVINSVQQLYSQGGIVMLINKQYVPFAIKTIRISSEQDQIVINRVPFCRLQS